MKQMFKLTTIVAMIGLSGCGRYTTSLTVENKASRPMMDVVFEYAGLEKRTNEINSGHSYRFQEGLSGEGVVMLRYRLGNAEYRQELCYYTFGLAPQGKLTVTDDAAILKC